MTFKRKDYASIIEKYQDEGTKYCLDILEGRLLAGELIKLACLRHMNDLRRSEEQKDEFPYDYSTNVAKGSVRFGEYIPDVSTGQQITLAGFQKFILCEIQAWKDRRTGGLRFNRVLISMARTNSKTQIASILALRDLLMGTPEFSRQIVVSSNNMTHVKQLYSYVRLSLHALERTSAFKRMASDITDNSEEVRISKYNTRLMQMSADSIGADSVHPTLAIFDEYHKQKTTNFINSLTSGNVQNPNARLIIISTAGEDPKVPMYDEYRRGREMLKHDDNRDGDDILFLVWEQDSNDEAFQPETWIKSNPLMELPALKNDLTTGVMKERNNQVDQGDLPQFLVKNMNRWQNAKQDSFLPLDLLQQAIIPVNKFNFDHRDVYIGWDASMVSDDSTLSFVFPYVSDDGQQKFHIWQHSWIPTKNAGSIEAKEKRDGINYRQSERDGFADITKDRFGMVNQETVFNWLLEFWENHDLNVKAILFDAWGTGAFIRRLDDVKSKTILIPVRQGTHTLSEPTKFLLDAFTEQRITIFDDHLLQAGFTNAVLKSDNNGIKIDKDQNSQKIDMVDATIDAFFEAMLYFDGWSNAPEEKEDRKNPFKGWSDEKINEYFKGDNFSF